MYYHSDKCGGLQLTVVDSLLSNGMAPLVTSIYHYFDVLSFFWIPTIGAKSRNVFNVYKFTIDKTIEPLILHKDHSCIVVHPTQKEAS